PEDRRAVAVVADRDVRLAEDEEADEGGDRPVGPFDPGLAVVRRREDLAVAERPVRAGDARAGRADDDADRDEEEGRGDGGGRELLVAGHSNSGTGRGTAAERGDGRDCSAL